MARTRSNLDWGWADPDASAWLDAHDLAEYFDGARYARTDLERGTVPAVLTRQVVLQVVPS